MQDGVESPVETKHETQSKASSPSSVDSIHDIDVDGEGEGEVDGQALPQQNAPVQKRKGGRKPIYATSEERKQRNRQAQAAFRERRTEYIKQLETTIKQQEDSLQNLQQSHRSAADECLMLRYKNSLLERILLEKGIDVQAELKRKEIVPPSRAPPPLPRPMPIQRPGSSRRSHAHRMSSGTVPVVPKPGQLFNSPQVKSDSASQVSSPSTTKSPTFGAPGMANHVQPGFQNHGHQQPIQQSLQHATQPQQRPLQPHPARSSTYPSLSDAATQPGLQPIAPNLRHEPAVGDWNSPFQRHHEQLEQEYGANDDLMEDTPDVIDEMHAGPGPYPQQFAHQQIFVTTGPPAIPITVGAENTIATPRVSQPGYGQGFPDPADPMLDADPFGLSASMHFPTQFSFNESSMRR